MEYQVTKPSFVRVNWTQVAFTFAACFAACLLAGGALYAIVYFIHRKPKAQENGNYTQAQQQRPIREKEKEIVEQVKDPQDHHEEKDRDEAQNDQEKDSEETDEKEPVKQVVQLNGVSKKKPLSVNR